MSDLVSILRQVASDNMALPEGMEWHELFNGAADEIERLQADNRKLLLAMVRIDYAAKCDWCADIAKSVLPDVMPAYIARESADGP